jgi:hypothetical protein
MNDVTPNRSVGDEASQHALKGKQQDSEEADANVVIAIEGP